MRNIIVCHYAPHGGYGHGTHERRVEVYIHHVVFYDVHHPCKAQGGFDNTSMLFLFLGFDNMWYNYTNKVKSTNITAFPCNASLPNLP
jgi:hypothetical protein